MLPPPRRSAPSSTASLVALRTTIVLLLVDSIVSADGAGSLLPPRPDSLGTGSWPDVDAASAALVVCAVDGTVYTLDAWTGGLRGLFASGPALVGGGGGAADPDGVGGRVIVGLDGGLFLTAVLPPDPDQDLENDEQDEEVPAPVILMDRLPVTAMDVVDSPVTQCLGGEEEDENCDLLMGQRRTTIFSLDPSTGTAHWMQRPTEPGDGFTSSAGAFGGSSRHSRGIKNSVLLQREDYVVRSVDAQTGEGRWDVTVGLFSALDFGSIRPRNRRMRRDEKPRGAVAASLARRASAGLLNIRRARRPGHGVSDENEDDCSNADDCDREFDDDNKNARNALVSLPSVAFGEDGTTITAVERSTGHILWRRRIESVAAAVYGVGDDGGWVPIDVFDAHDTFAPRHQISGSVGGVGLPAGPHNFGDGKKRRDQMLSPPSSRADPSFTPSSASTSLSLIPYGHGALRGAALIGLGVDSTKSGRVLHDRRRVAKLGRHSSTLFVASASECWSSDCGEGAARPLLLPHLSLPTSPLDPNLLSGTDEPPPGTWSQQDICNAVGEDGTALLGFAPWPWEHCVNKDVTDHMTAAPGFAPGLDGADTPTVIASGPLPNHTSRSEHGLFLSWQAVTLLITALFTATICLRLAYVQQRQKWRAEATPQLLPTEPNSLKMREGENKPSSSPMLLDLNTGSNSGVSFSLQHRDVPSEHCQLLSTSAQNKQHQTPLTVRSMSLPHLTSLNLEGKNSLKKSNMISLVEDKKDENNANFFEGNSNWMLGESEPGHNSDVISAPTSGLTIHTATNKTATKEILPPQMSSGVKSQVMLALEQQELMDRVGNIDGIPLVRYSRYRSEFKELSPLGKGGFGTVFQCSNMLDGREYAIKKILIELHADVAGRVTKKFSQRLQRVLREVKILARLDHPNIVRYYTAWLELEDRGKEGNDDPNGSLSSDTFGGGTTRCFSSELFTNTMEQSGAPDTMSHRVNHKQIATTSTSKSKSRFNPLGWNNFYSSFQPDGQNVSIFDSVSEEWGSTDDAAEAHQSVFPTEDDDLGFTWERSTSSKLKSPPEEENSNSDSSYATDISLESDRNRDSTVAGGSSGSSESQSDQSNSSSVLTHKNTNGRNLALKESSSVKKLADSSPSCASPSLDSDRKKKTQTRAQWHILYIQMQLCSQKNLGDFLVNPQARKGPGIHTAGLKWETNDVDIPHALLLFSQIARGVKNVHQQGLIHRDLKPSNCFIDDVGAVKIGDFGLSRESAATEEIRNVSDTNHGHKNSSGENLHGLLGGDDNTVGVGTRSYASPEQMSGSDYDASTDVYSLGVMLFELCYPMYTGMERHMVFKGMRKRMFPDQWHSTVAVAFPSLHTLLMQMLSPIPSERPTSAAVADHVGRLLSEYTILSLDRAHRSEGSVLLRIEAIESEGVLRRTTKMIQDADPSISILQYGLRGHESKAIMEFALSIPGDIGANDDDGDVTSKNNATENIINALKKNEEIKVVRQVTEQVAPGRGNSLNSIGHHPSN